MGLVHGQVGQQAAGAQVHEAGLERGRRHHLWGDVEQLQLGAAAPQVSQDETALACWEFGVDGAGWDVETLQAVHLVLGRDTGWMMNTQNFGRISSVCMGTERSVTCLNESN